MSALTNFVNANFLAARTVIGGETIAIGDGDAVSGVVSELDTSRDFEVGGFDVEESISVVVRLSDFVAAYPNAVKTYHGKKATVRGNTYRVGSTRVGQHAVTINLISTTESA